jgi:hypothetical protein
MRLKFFVTSCFLGGLGGFVGSVLGGFLGQYALFIGGFLGGVLIAPLSAGIALWRQWIGPAQYWPTTLGAALGFAAAAVVAMNTLSSPVGPIVSTTLTGIGALVGSWFSSSRGDPS